MSGGDPGRPAHDQSIGEQWRTSGPAGRVSMVLGALVAAVFLVLLVALLGRWGWHAYRWLWRHG